VLAAARDRRSADPEGARASERRRSAEHRVAAVAVYGGQCAACGRGEGLQFDHVHGDGEAHRRVETQVAMLRRISRTGRRLPDWQLQLLCRPCHKVKSAAEATARSATTGRFVPAA